MTDWDGGRIYHMRTNIDVSNAAAIAASTGASTEDEDLIFNENQNNKKNNSIDDEDEYELNRKAIIDLIGEDEQENKSTKNKNLNPNAKTSTTGISTPASGILTPEIAIKKFKDFIRNFTTNTRSSYFPYRFQLLQNANNEMLYLEILLEDLTAFDPFFSNEIQQNPTKYIPLV